MRRDRLHKHPISVFLPREGDGFEPSVPGTKGRFLLRKANCGTERGQPKRVVSYAVPMVRIHLPQRRVWCEPDFRGRIPSMTVGSARSRGEDWGRASNRCVASVVRAESRPYPTRVKACLLVGV